GLRHGRDVRVRVVHSLRQVRGATCDEIAVAGSCREAVLFTGVIRSSNRQRQTDQEQHCADQATPPQVPGLHLKFTPCTTKRPFLNCIATTTCTPDAPSHSAVTAPSLSTTVKA